MTPPRGISWARKPISARKAGSWRGAPPSTVISPAVGLAKPASRRSSVLLPAPFGPIRADIRPSGRVAAQSLRAVTRRHCFDSPPLERLGPQNGVERLADVLHLLHLHEVGKSVGALQGRS